MSLRNHRYCNRSPGTLLIFALYASMPQLAMAEQADRNKPTNIEADVATVDQNNRVKTLEGNVILMQGTMRLVAQRMVVKEDDEGYIKAEIFGGGAAQVAFRQKREGSEDYMEGYADRAEFDDRADTLKLYSKARLKNGADELKGEYIYYNSATEVVQARNSIPNGKPASESVPPAGRVNITIQPRVAGEKSSLPLIRDSKNK
jgi:lipopolysaccharide export system protein LptA